MLIARRSEICLERQIGLTKLYNEVDDGAYRATCASCTTRSTRRSRPPTAGRRPRRTTRQESNRLLLELNRAIAAGEIDYRPFG